MVKPWRYCLAGLAAAILAALGGSGLQPGIETKDRDAIFNADYQAYLESFLRDDSGTIAPDGYARALAFRESAVAGKTPIRTETRAGLSPASWTSLGPSTTSVGGRVSALALTPGNPAQMWLGTPSGGLYKSTDSGTGWSPVANFPSGLPVSAIVISPTNTSLIFVSTGDRDAGDAIGNGIYRSVDGGMNWAQIPATSVALDVQWQRVYGLAMQPGNPNRLIAARVTGIMVSDDGGTTWTAAGGADTSGGSSSNPVRGLTYDPNNSANVIAGSLNGVLYSRDGGKTFTQVNVGPGSARVEPVYAASTAGLVYASVDEDSGTIYKSVDGGATWAVVSNSKHLGSQGWYGNVLWVDPINANGLVTGGVDLFRSLDGGVTFSRISDWARSPPYPHADHHVLVTGANFSAAARPLYVGTDGGLWRTTDYSTAGATSSTNNWTALNTGLNSFQFNGVTVSPTADVVIAGAQDNGTQKLGANKTGRAITSGDGGQAIIDPATPANVYASYIYANISRSTDGGNRFTEICAGIAEANKDYCDGDGTAAFYAPYILDPNQTKRLLAGARSLWVTENATASSVVWTAVKGPLDAPADKVTISAIAVAPGNSNIAWVGYANGVVVKSVDATSQTPIWTNVTSLVASRKITGIMIDKSDANRVMVTLGGYQSGNIQLTTDGGLTWTSLTTGLPRAPVYVVRRHPANINWLYAGTQVGLFTSENGGVTWSAATDGPGTVQIRDIQFPGDGTRIFLATYGRGIYSADTGAPVAQVAQSGWWWNASASGRGMSIEFMPNKLFMASYHYDATGKAQWWITTATSTDGANYSGRLLQISGGQTLTGAYKAAGTTTDLGAVSLSFTGAAAGVITWPSSIGAPDTISRYNIVTNGVSTGSGSYPETGWYWNADEGGRGWFLEVQNGTMFLSGFMYRADGSSVWYVAQAAMTGTTSATATLTEYSDGPMPGTATARTAIAGAGQTITLRFTQPTAVSVPDSLILTLPNGTELALVRYRF